MRGGGVFDGRRRQMGGRFARSVGSGPRLFRRAASALGGHMRGNVVAYVALFFALTGTATALSGSNTVFSDDIVNGQVKRGDLAPNAVSTSRVADESLLGSDVRAGSLSGSDVNDGSLSGSDVGADTLTGEKIRESSLAEVPSAAVGGRGAASTEGTCDPEDEVFVSCGFVSLNVPSGASGARALLVGRIRARFDDGTGVGSCRLATSTVGPVPNSTVPQDTIQGSAYAPLTGVTPPLSPGRVNDFGIECTEEAGGIRYDEAAIEAVLISP